MFTVYRKSYPQTDIDFLDYCDFADPSFDTLPEAEKLADELTRFYSADEWSGHWLHNSKFYADIKY